MHTIQAFGHLQFTNIEFLPLFLFFFLKMIEEKKHAHAVGAALSFVLLTFMGDIEQGLMAMLMAFFVLLYFLALKEHRRKLLDKKFAISLAEMAVVVLVLSSPFIFGILSALTPSALATVNSQANTMYNELYSPDLLSFFVPSSFNGMLSFLSGGFSAIISPAASERTTYIGYSVIFLALVALVYEYKEKFKSVGLFLVLLVLFGLLSIGPYLQINGNITIVPGIYQIYHLIPVFNVLREPGRFDLLLELFFAIFAAIGITVLEKKYASSSIKKYIPAIFLILIIFEYNSWPISSGMLNKMYTFNTTIPTAYYEIGRLGGNFSVLMLPALPNYSSTTPDLYPGRALYYQTAFQHPLVGGYATRVNATQTFLLVNMPIIASAYYLQNGQGLVYGSPVSGNYSNSTAFLLGVYNVGFVAVDRQAYNTSELQQMASYLVSFLGYPVYQGNDSIIFPTNKLVSSVGTFMTEYTPVLFNSPYSVWQPGWVLCNNSPYCTNDTLNAYFGANPAFVNIYTPNYTRLNISFRGIAPIGTANGTVGLYFNDQFVEYLNLTLVPRNFSVAEVLNPGINSLLFLSSNSTAGSYSNIGISNLTFKKYS
jgi:hypothetical protein